MQNTKTSPLTTISLQYLIPSMLTPAHVQHFARHVSSLEIINKSISRCQVQIPGDCFIQYRPTHLISAGLIAPARQLVHNLTTHNTCHCYQHSNVFREPSLSFDGELCSVDGWDCKDLFVNVSN